MRDLPMPLDSRSLQQAIVAAAADAIFGQPLVENIYRGTLVEAIVASALQPQGWRRADSWGGWDLEHPDGTRLEVKQAAMRQTWDETRTINRKLRFDIATRTGHFDAMGWHQNEELRRFADLYVFAYHPVVDATAEHRDPAQWRFYVLATMDLPHTRTLSLKKLQGMADGISYDELSSRVAEVTAGIRLL